MTTEKRPFGKNRFGESVDLFMLTNRHGMNVSIMSHGGTIVSLEVPDRNGQMADIVLGHDTAAEYVQETPYFGAAIGRFANRIRGGTFTLNGKAYALALNNGPNALHGGRRGFDKVIWEAELLKEKNALRLTYISPDGEEGFPGEVKTVMTYRLTEENELSISYAAETTRATPYNITNHSYFNLAGHDAGTVGGHSMMIKANTFLPTDESAIPYGHEAPVAGTPFDFRTATAIGARIETDDEQIRFGKGYDHTFCLEKQSAGELSLAARAADPLSGRIMEVYTTEPGVQFYTGNYLDGTLRGKGGCRYVRRAGFCLETQHYPDSPNQPPFPDAILRPGSPFLSQTIHKFMKG